MKKLERHAKDFFKSRFISRLPLEYKLEIYYADSRLLPSHKCLFIHVPKTGGTSIAQALANINSAKACKEVSKFPSTFNIALPKHATAQEMRKWLGNDIYDNYFSFAMVRNPWDLMVSYYHYWVQSSEDGGRKYGQNFQPILEKIKKLSGFDDFIRSEYTYQLLRGKRDIFEWISYNDQIIVDWVGKYENLQEDWQKVCKRLGVTHHELPHRNKSDHLSYRQYYTKETQQIVAQRFQKTIDTFDYMF